MFETTSSLFLTPALVTLQDGEALPNTVPGIGGGEGGVPIQGEPPPSGGAQPAPSPFGNTIFLMLALVLVFMIVSTMMTSRREKKRVAEMLGSMKRGDRVVTTSGMFGTVQEVKEDSVVLRIDDVAGTKARFTKSAVQQVVKSSPGESKVAEQDAAESA